MAQRSVKAALREALNIIDELMASYDWVGTGSQESGAIERKDFEARVASLRQVYVEVTRRPVEELDAIIAGLTENQRYTIRGEYEKSGYPHLGRAYLPNKWISLHSNRVIDGIVSRGLTRRRTQQEIEHALFVEKRNSVGHECLNELGVQVAERLAALTAEIGYMPGKEYFAEKGIKAR